MPASPRTPKPHPRAVLADREFELSQRILIEQGVDTNGPSSTHYDTWRAAVHYGYASETELDEAARLWGDLFHYAGD